MTDTTKWTASALEAIDAALRDADVKIVELDGDTQWHGDDRPDGDRYAVCSATVTRTWGRRTRGNRYCTDVNTARLVKGEPRVEWHRVHTTHPTLEAAMLAAVAPTYRPRRDGRGMHYPKYMCRSGRRVSWLDVMTIVEAHTAARWCRGGIHGDITCGIATDHRPHAHTPAASVVDDSGPEGEQLEELKNTARVTLVVRHDGTSTRHPVKIPTDNRTERANDQQLWLRYRDDERFRAMIDSVRVQPGAVTAIHHGHRAAEPAQDAAPTDDVTVSDAPKASQEPAATVTPIRPAEPVTRRLTKAERKAANRQLAAEVRALGLVPNGDVWERAKQLKAAGQPVTRESVAA